MKRIDLVLIFATLGLLLFSIFFVYSSSVSIDSQLESNQFIRQVFNILIGIVVLTSINFIPFEQIKAYIPVLYGVCLILLLATVFFGQIKNGSKAWLNFGPVGMQPSEFVKVATILLYAYFLEKNGKSINNLGVMILYGLIGIIPIGIILLQPDLGTALVYIPIVLIIFYISGTDTYKVAFIAASGVISILTLVIAYFIAEKFSVDSQAVILLRSNSFIVYIIILLALGVLASIGRLLNHFKRFFNVLAYSSFVALAGASIAYVATIVLKPYQLQRLLVFVNPESDPLGSGWHILQSVTAIGSGGIFGDGFLKGQQSNLEFLPQKSTDFIYSLIGEEMGFVGTGLVLLLYTLLFWRIVIIGLKSKSMFSKICCAGVFAMFLTHFIVNVGMTIGIMPITGIPLLLVSYGGSSIVSALIAIGIVHNIYYNESFKNETAIFHI